MAPDGGSQRRVVEHGGHMSWLPGGRIIYINAGHLRIVEVATGRDEPFDVRGPEPMPIFAASPDGQWIVYQSSVKDKGVDIAIASIPGGEGRWLVRTDKEDYHASFAPSGRWVYFQIDHRNIWRVPGPAQGWREAPPEQVTFMNEPGLFPEDPQLSADGKRLFYSKVQTRGDLWMVELPKR
jgi:Tol biopolymer transport system component